VTIQITETSGKGATVVLGGSPNASDAEDDLDRPEPPAPPVLSYVRAWFTTPFSIPFNRLLQEYKHVPSERMEWNLSLLWVSEQGNDSFTTINISWDPTQAIQSSYNSFQLYENNTAIADMLTESSYSFLSNGTLHHFQIIGQKTSTNGTTEQNGLSIFPILLGVSVLIIVIIIAVFIYYKRKQKQRNQYNEKVRKRIQQQHLEEIKKLLEEQKNLSAIKEKIQDWKNQGYNVEELEKAIEEHKEKRGNKKKRKKRKRKKI
jgi:hypothetical protein